MSQSFFVRTGGHHPNDACRRSRRPCPRSNARDRGPTRGCRLSSRGGGWAAPGVGRRSASKRAPRVRPCSRGRASQRSADAARPGAQAPVPCRVTGSLTARVPRPGEACPRDAAGVPGGRDRDAEDGDLLRPAQVRLRGSGDEQGRQRHVDAGAVQAAGPLARPRDRVADRHRHEDDRQDVAARDGVARFARQPPVECLLEPERDVMRSAALPLPVPGFRPCSGWRSGLGACATHRTLPRKIVRVSAPRNMSDRPIETMSREGRVMSETNDRLACFRDVQSQGAAATSEYIETMCRELGAIADRSQFHDLARLLGVAATEAHIAGRKHRANEASNERGSAEF